MARTNIWAQWKLQGGEERKGWQNITGYQIWTNLVTHIKKFGLFLRIMGKVELEARR